MGNRRPLAPIAHDWLYSCQVGTPVAAIRAALAMPFEPLSEFSARDWEAPGRLGFDLFRAAGEPESWRPFGEASDDWTFLMLDEVLFSKSWGPFRIVNGRGGSGPFQGELMVIRYTRDTSPATAQSLATLLDWSQSKIKWIEKGRRSHALQSHAKIAVVLEGWDRSSFTSTRLKVALAVNPLPAIP
jgi:hypothetical protein